MRVHSGGSENTHMLSHDYGFLCRFRKLNFFRRELPENGRALTVLFRDVGPETGG